MKIPRLSLSRRGIIVILTCVCVLAWVFGRQRILQMDGRFFEPSGHGALGLVFYLFGDYARAAKSYQAHYQEEILGGGSFGDQTLDAIVLGEKARATALARAALERDPDNIGARLTLGEVAYEEGAFDQALQWFTEALERKPEDIDALVLSSLAHARTGAYESAIERFNRAFRFNRVESRVTTYLKLMEATGNFASKPAPEKPFCLLAQYYRYFRIFDHSNARLVIAYAKKAIAAGDRAADAYLSMGITYEREGERARALSALLKAVELDPKHAYAYRWAAVVYSARGDLANEYRMRRAAAESAPEDPYYTLELGEFLETRMGDYQQALALVQAGLEKAPSNVELLGRAASLYTSMGEYERAVEVYQTALSLAPRNPFLHDGIGYPLMELGRLEEAMTAYRAAVALKPDLSHAHLLLATLLQRQRQTPEAIREYETAFRFRRPETRDLAQLCALYHWSSQFQRAAGCFRQVLAEDPRNRVANDLLPYTLRNLQQKGTP